MGASEGPPGATVQGVPLCGLQPGGALAPMLPFPRLHRPPHPTRLTAATLDLTPLLPERAVDAGGQRHHDETREQWEEQGEEEGEREDERGEE